MSNKSLKTCGTMQNHHSNSFMVSEVGTVYIYQFFAKFSVTTFFLVISPSFSRYHNQKNVVTSGKKSVDVQIRTFFVTRTKKHLLRCKISPLALVEH